MRWALLAIAMAGCFTPGISCYSPYVIEWDDPALFDAVSGNTTLEGIPLQGSTNASIAALGAERVWFMAHGTGVRLDADGWLRGQYRTPPDEVALHQAVTAFLQNATDLTAAEMAAAADVFIASREDGSATFYEAPPQPWNLGKAFDASGASPDNPGRRGDAWNWELVWPAKHVDVEGLPVRVDARGHASIEEPDAFRGLEDDEAVIERVTRRLTQAGYPAPQDIAISASMC